MPVVSDMSTNGNSNDDCSSGSGGGSPDAAGSEGVGNDVVQTISFQLSVSPMVSLYLVRNLI